MEAERETLAEAFPCQIPPVKHDHVFRALPKVVRRQTTARDRNSCTVFNGRVVVTVTPNTIHSEKFTKCILVYGKLN